MLWHKYGLTLLQKATGSSLTFMGPCIVIIFWYISNKMKHYTVYFIWKLLYMFRVVPPPIIRSTNNYIYSIWYLSHRYCYLSLSWKIWNWFQCAVGGVKCTLVQAPRFCTGRTAHRGSRGIALLFLDHGTRSSFKVLSQYLPDVQNTPSSTDGFSDKLWTGQYEFIHLAVCLTTGPKPLPKRAIHIVRSRASSFKW